MRALLVVAVAGSLVLTTLPLSEEKKEAWTPPLVPDFFSLFDYPGIDAILQCSVWGEAICVIKENWGGTAWEFQRAADDVLAGGKTTVVIDGKCFSACAVAADRAREKFCITKQASFYFHKSFTKDKEVVGGVEKEVKTNLLDPPQSEEIHRWVYNKQRGGYPVDGFVEMSAREAAVYWSQCELDPPLPYPRPRQLQKQIRTEAVFQAHGLY